MKEVTVASWDDLHYSQGERVPAAHGPSTVLRLNSRTVELDLTDEHQQELAAMLEPWLAAGHNPEHDIKKQTGGAGHPIGDLAASRAYNRGMAAWADEHGAEGIYAYNKPGHNGHKSSYFPRALRLAYAEHLASQVTRGGARP